MKKIYHYNEYGYFCGQDIADESPLEPGVFLIPALATDQEPPMASENQLVRFVEGSWVLEDIPELEPIIEPEPQAPTIITPVVDENISDLYQAMFDMSARLEKLEGGAV